ncbi:MAG: hypothetical protein GY906_13015 [bacterium]|nr:hypothetical protein [bacterium]
MALGFSSEFATSYTQLRDLLASKMVAAGWTQVGATEIYKSPVADDNGFYAYVEVSDNGVNYPKLSTSSRLNAAGTALFKPIASDCQVSTWNRLWHFYIFDKWVYCFGLNETSAVKEFMGAGLFRAYPHATCAHNPVVLIIGWGSESGVWIPVAGQPGISSRILYQDGTAKYAGQGMSMMSTVSSSNVRSVVKDQVTMGGGMFIQPVMLWTSGAQAIEGVLGSIYNAIQVGTAGWASGVVLPGNSIIDYGGKTYVTAQRPYLHAPNNTGMGIAFQIGGF